MGGIVPLQAIYNFLESAPIELIGHGSVGKKYGALKPGQSSLSACLSVDRWTGVTGTTGLTVRKGVINMPKIVSQVKLIYQMMPTASVEEAANLWTERLVAMAQKINQRRKERIPDGERFIQRIAGVSAKAWRSVINPAFNSRAGMDSADITANQAAKVQEAYQKYESQWDHIFETVDGVPAKRYIDLVQQAKEAYKNGIAKHTLPFTGSKMQGRGISSLAALWLTGDPITEGELRGADIIVAGGPYRICPGSKKPGLKTLLNQRLIQAGVAIVKSGFDATVMAKQNQLTAEQVQGFTDPALDLIPFVAGGDSHVDFIYEAGVFYLEIKVSKM
jgi:hypothetical protein